MHQIVGVTKLQRHFKYFFDQVVHKQTPIVLTRGSRPEAVLISYEDYLEFQQMRESEVLAGFDKIWERLDELNEEHTDDEIVGDIESALQGQDERTSG